MNSQSTDELSNESLALIEKALKTDGQSLYGSDLQVAQVQLIPSESIEQRVFVPNAVNFSMVQTIKFSPDGSIEDPKIRTLFSDEETKEIHGLATKEYVSLFGMMKTVVDPDFHLDWNGYSITACVLPDEYHFRDGKAFPNELIIGHEEKSKTERVQAIKEVLPKLSELVGMRGHDNVLKALRDINAESQSTWSRRLDIKLGDFTYDLPQVTQNLYESDQPLGIGKLVYDIFLPDGMKLSHPMIKQYYKQKYENYVN